MKYRCTCSSHRGGKQTKHRFLARQSIQNIRVDLEMETTNTYIEESRFSCEICGSWGACCSCCCGCEGWLCQVFLGRADLLIEAILDWYRDDPWYNLDEMKEHLEAIVEQARERTIPQSFEISSILMPCMPHGTARYYVTPELVRYLLENISLPQQTLGDKLPPSLLR